MSFVFYRTRGDSGAPQGRPHLVQRMYDDDPTDPYLLVHHAPDCGEMEMWKGYKAPACYVECSLQNGGDVPEQLAYSGDEIPTADLFWVEGWAQVYPPRWAGLSTTAAFGSALHRRGTDELGQRTHGFVLRIRRQRWRSNARVVQGRRSRAVDRRRGDGVVVGRSPNGSSPAVHWEGGPLSYYSDNFLTLIPETVSVTVELPREEAEGLKRWRTEVLSGKAHAAASRCVDSATERFKQAVVKALS